MDRGRRCRRRGNRSFPAIAFAVFRRRNHKKRQEKWKKSSDRRKGAEKSPETEKWFKTENIIKKTGMNPQKRDVLHLKTGK